ncbi:MAG TPA: isochorismatase family cysteine hydrolase [bacterium]|nr:isochorismatase family cysteine hydrolase [bacterium]HPL95185.1 isochorismatase family cysteine hydrolase [bacterium]
MRKALIVIDIQRGFLNPLTKNLPAKIKKFLELNKNNFNLILFTQYFNRPNSPFVKFLNWRGFIDKKENDLCEEIKPLINKNNLFKKYTYSSFVDNKLLNILKKNKIGEVYLMGISTENCVLTFSRDAFDRGFKVVVLKNYCASADSKKLHQAALEIIKNNIGQVK